MSPNPSRSIFGIGGGRTSAHRKISKTLCTRNFHRSDRPNFPFLFKTMGTGAFLTLLSKVASAIIIFSLGALCAVVVLLIYDMVYPPIQVTCWYCNEQSALKARGEETSNRWYCRKCENLNVRDEVRCFSSWCGSWLDHVPLLEG